jgi:hypothetical protein
VEEKIMKQIDGIWTTISSSEASALITLCLHARQATKIYKLADLTAETSLAKDVTQLHRFFTGVHSRRVRTKYLRKMKKFGDTFPDYIFDTEAKVLAQIKY